MTMKKYIILLITMATAVLPANVFGQIAGGAPSKIWTYPAVTALDEEVTWYFDMTGSAFTDGQELYLWAWSPSEPDAGNWANSSAFAKLDYVGNMVWKKTLTPTLYFNTTVDNIKASAGFWMRLKDHTGTIQSDVINVPGSWLTLDNFIASNKAVQIFPEKFYLDQPLSIIVNAKYVWTGSVQGGLVGSSELHLHSGLNTWSDSLRQYKAWLPDVVASTKFKSLGNDIYKFDMIPSQYYNTGDGFVMENISFVIPNADWSKVGQDQGPKDFIFTAPGVVVLEPVLSIFPKNFSQLDLFTISRTNNEKNVTKLTYTITAGDKTLTGDFTGTRSLMNAYVDLLTGLAGSPSLDKIHILVKDNNGRAILDTDVSLVKLTDVE